MAYLPSPLGLVYASARMTACGHIDRRQYTMAAIWLGGYLATADLGSCSATFAIAPRNWRLDQNNLIYVPGYLSRHPRLNPTVEVQSSSIRLLFRTLARSHVYSHYSAITSSSKSSPSPRILSGTYPEANTPQEHPWVAMWSATLPCRRSGVDMRNALTQFTRSIDALPIHPVFKPALGK